MENTSPLLAADLAARLEKAFPEKIEWAERSPKRLYVDLVAPKYLPEVFTWCRDNIPGFRLGTSTAIDLREGIGVFHHCAINGQALMVSLKVLAPKPDPSVPSLAPIVPAAEWIEREMHDMLGVVFDGHPDLRRLVKAEAFPDTFPLRRGFDPKAFKESIGEHLEF